MDIKLFNKGDKVACYKELFGKPYLGTVVSDCYIGSTICKVILCGARKSGDVSIGFVEKTISQKVIDVTRTITNR